MLEGVLEDLKKETGFFCIFLDPDLDPDEALAIREESEYGLALESLGFSKEERVELLETSGFQAYRELERLKASIEHRRQELIDEIFQDKSLSTRERVKKIQDLDRRLLRDMASQSSGKSKSSLQAK